LHWFIGEHLVIDLEGVPDQNCEGP
jgi:hypothetical protein